jgi:hypothetical protein
MVLIRETSFCIKFEHLIPEEDLKEELNDFVKLMVDSNSKVISYDLRGTI